MTQPRTPQLRGCPLKGLAACPTLDAQRARFLACGFAAAEALDINDVYARLPAQDRVRMERLEPLDEFEEWRLINAHYCMSWAWAGFDGAEVLPQPPDQRDEHITLNQQHPALPAGLPSALRPGFSGGRFFS